MDLSGKATQDAEPGEIQVGYGFAIVAFFRARVEVFEGSKKGLVQGRVFKVLIGHENFFCPGARGQRLNAWKVCFLQLERSSRVKTT